MAYLYILYSERTDSYYVGCCNDLHERIRRHNSGHSLSTRKGIPWKLVYEKVYPTKGDAMKEESRIKRQKSRIYLERLISVG